jgi:undecaprenyl pyrophosphate phosphatase UppP
MELIIKATIMGVVEGITEFVPISDSARYFL